MLSWRLSRTGHACMVAAVFYFNTEMLHHEINASWDKCNDERVWLSRDILIFRMASGCRLGSSWPTCLDPPHCWRRSVWTAGRCDLCLTHTLDTGRGMGPLPLAAGLRTPPAWRWWWGGGEEEERGPEVWVGHLGAQEWLFFRTLPPRGTRRE